ncbi:MAG: MFS transporter [Acidimicrobiia bacterium]
MNEPGSVFRSLRTRNYWLFFLGQTASQIGTWAQSIALGWLVLDLSRNDGLAVGFLTALIALPTLFLGAWGGVLADRFDNRRLLLGAQLVLAAVSTVLALLVVTDTVELWMVYVLALVGGFAQVVDNPTRQSFLSEMVTPAELPNAVGLNSAIAQSARIVGPAIAGVLIVAVGTGICFAIDAVSFLAVIAALLMMRPAELHPRPRATRAPGQVREGLRYAWASPELRNALLIAAVLGTFALNWGVIYPLFAKVTFHTDAAGFSLMTTVMSIGALTGALTVARLGLRSARAVVLGGFAMGAFTVLAAWMPVLWLFLLVLPAVGFSMIVHMVSTNAFLQLHSDPAMRGRVMALYAITIFGLLPIGGPLMGWVSDATSPRVAFTLAGVSSLVSCTIFGLRLLRRATPVPVGV